MNNISNIKVSVIVPVYNVEKYLEKCLLSLQEQTLRSTDYEVIIIDDKSSDSSLRIAEKFVKGKSNFKLLRNKKNIGLGLTRNRGIKNAVGEYIYFIDSDDYLDPVTLEVLYNGAVLRNVDIVTGGFNKISEKGEVLYSTRFDNSSEKYNNDRLVMLRNLANLSLSLTAWNRLIRKSIFTENKILFPSGLHEDISTVFKLHLYAKSCYFDDGIYYYWLSREKSITSRITKENIEGFITGMESIPLEVRKFGGIGLYSAIKSDYWNGLLIAFNTLFNRILQYKNSNSEKYLLIHELFNRIRYTSEYNEIIANEGNITVQIIKAISLIAQLNHTKVQFVEKIAEKYEELKNDSKFSEGKFEKLKNKINRLRKELSQTKNNRTKILMIKNKILNKIANKAIALSKQNNEPKDNNNEIYLFHRKLFIWCDVDYQLRNAIKVSLILKKKNKEVVILDNTKQHLAGKRSLSRIEYSNIPKEIKIINSTDLDINIFDNESPLALITFNDINKLNPIIRKLRIKGVPTFAINEGVSDYLKLDCGFPTHLYPYRTSEYLFVPGEYDTRFFEDRKDKVFVSGLPMVRKLYEEDVQFPKTPIAVINVNFSYGVLTDKRDIFVKTAIEGCKLAGIDYVLSQHPADNGELSEFNVTKESMYDCIRNSTIFISRFSGAIIESLALGKPVVYHNPIGEKVIKFQEPLGAYSISTDAKSLAKAIKAEINKAKKQNVREYANRFLDLHANINSKKRPEELIAEYIEKIIKK